MANILFAILLTIFGTTCAYHVTWPRPRFHQTSLTAVTTVLVILFLISEEQREFIPNPYYIEIFKPLGQLSVPVAVGLFIINSNNQATKDLIMANKELITANKNISVESIKANKELIAANKEMSAESIMTAKTRIENILLLYSLKNPSQSSSNITDSLKTCQLSKL